jgi:hypothetical protein
VAPQVTNFDLFVFMTGGGLLGAAFMGFYFSMEDPEEQAGAQWMLWGGIAAMVVAVILVFGFRYFRSKSAARTEYLEQKGVLALAEVVGLTETFAALRDDNDYPMTKLELRISGPNLTPFNARKRVQASTETQHSIIIGRKLVVLVDPTDNSYQIDWQRSASVAGVVPVILTSTQDNRTYDLTGQVGPIMEYFQVLKANRIPHSRHLDVRDNPDVREQLLAIARRAESAQH